MKKFFSTIRQQGVLISAVVMAGAGMLGMGVALEGKIAPNTTMANVVVGLKDAEEVKEAFSQMLDRFEQAPVAISYPVGGSAPAASHVFTLNELGVTLLKTQSLEKIHTLNVVPPPRALFEEKKITPHFILDREKLRATLESRFIDLTLKTQNAQLAWNSGRREFDILPEQPGWHADLDTFVSELTAHIENLYYTPISLLRIHDAPAVTADELARARLYIKERVSRPLTLKSPEDEWEINWLDHMDWLDIQPQAAPAGQLRVNPAPFKEFIAAQIVPELEVASQDVTIFLAQGTDLSSLNSLAPGAITFEGAAIDGITLETETLMHLVNLALRENLSTVEIPTRTTPGRVNSPPELQALGIKELVATGFSGFYNSPSGRRHNIGVAIDRFNGILVEPGEIFSFGEHLGEVDGSTGYVKELVIREGETIPEYGGGVCQVSSTLFRAILFGGFPIVERHPHSYAVSYYAYPLGWGLDATVYPPAVDLKFKNDMSTHLLIQSYTENSEATFKFYGTVDGRTVTMDGPYITDRKPAPPPIYVETDTLAPGQKEKKDTAHNGFTATWKRTVNYPAGHPALIDTIVSPYVPWPERWLVGSNG